MAADLPGDFRAGGAAARRGARLVRAAGGARAERCVTSSLSFGAAALLLFSALLAIPGRTAAATSGATASDGATAVDGGVTSGETSGDAVHLRRGSVASRQIVALGRPLWIEGEALANAAVLQGDARIDGVVRGDVIALGGDVVLSARAQVDGDVYAVGGTIEAADGSVIGGRTAAYPDAPSTALVLMEGPALGLAPGSRPVLAAKAAVLCAWLVLALLAAALGCERPLRRTGERLRDRPLRSFFVGLLAVASTLVGLVLFSAFAPATVGLPIAVVGIAGLTLAKVWGTVAVFEAVGSAASRRMGAGMALPLRLVLGACLLGWIKFVPWLGTVAWSMLTLVAIGATLAEHLLSGGEPADAGA